MNWGEIIWYIFTLRENVKSETKDTQGEWGPVKGRSELETETIIWYFFFPHKAVQKLCCLVSSCLIVGDMHLNPYCCSFSCLCYKHSWTYTDTLWQAPFSRKNSFPLYILQQEMLKSDAQWTTVTFMGQDAHSNASWFSQQGMWDTMTPTCKTLRANSEQDQKKCFNHRLEHMNWLLLREKL